MPSPENENSPPGTKRQLIVALARGGTVAAWARKNNVSRRMAQRWAREPEVRAAVEQMRRRALDQAIGLMSTSARSAAKQIIELGSGAESESVRLSALRSILSDMIAVSKFGSLEDRMTEIEEHIHAESGSASRAV